MERNSKIWKKSKYYLSKHDNILIEYGADNKGDLFNVKNLWHCYNKYNGTIDFITGDGGFDFSVDFNKQEAYAIRLIFSQISDNFFDSHRTELIIGSSNA